jgi:hypothetical protein
VPLPSNPTGGSPPPHPHARTILDPDHRYFEVARTGNRDDLSVGQKLVNLGVEWFHPGLLRGWVSSLKASRAFTTCMRAPEAFAV